MSDNDALSSLEDGQNLFILIFIMFIVSFHTLFLISRAPDPDAQDAKIPEQDLPR